MYFIKNAENLDVVPESVYDEGLKKDYEDAARHNWTQAELDAYDYVSMREQDDRGRFTLGIRRERESIAKNFLKLGLSIIIIAENTGLIIEEVRKLQGK